SLTTTLILRYKRSNYRSLTIYPLESPLVRESFELGLVFLNCRGVARRALPYPIAIFVVVVDGGSVGGDDGGVGDEISNYENYLDDGRRLDGGNDDGGRDSEVPRTLLWYQVLEPHRILRLG
ncbi:hypothetical protein GW17_00053235, partial [Ensete ventricosum]